MDFGLITPVVNLNPRFDPPAWELGGGIEDVVALSVEAERLGYRWVGCPEHVAVPAGAASVRGGRYYDPLSTLAFVAARTSRIRLLSHVAVLGYHHPLDLVKRFGTLDVISGGRFVLGVGVGSLEEEFELLGTPFADRGARGDDALRAVRACWGRPVATYLGSHYRFQDMVVEPSGSSPAPTIWVGGRSGLSLRRALELGDGWIPFGLDLVALSALLGRHDLPAGFDVVLAPEPPLDPLAHPDAAADAVAACAAAGASALALRFVHRSRAHYLEQLAALAALTGLAVPP